MYCLAAPVERTPYNSLARDLPERRSVCFGSERLARPDYARFDLSKPRRQTGNSDLIYRLACHTTVLNNLRTRLGPALAKMGSAFASTGISADVWTGVGLALAIVSAVVYAAWDVSYVLVVGGALLLASGFFDMVDGQVARATGKTTKRGAFLDSVFDKVAEVAIFFGVMLGGHAEPYLVLAAITLSLLVSYSRARAESLGIKLQGIGIGERAERLLVVAVVGMIGFMDIAMAIVIVIAGVTFIQRVVVTAKSVRE